MVTSEPSLSSIFTSRSAEKSVTWPVISRDTCDEASSTILAAISRDRPNLAIWRCSSRARRDLEMLSRLRDAAALLAVFFVLLGASRAIIAATTVDGYSGQRTDKRANINVP
jgi:hypothetical protein